MKKLLWIAVAAVISLNAAAEGKPSANASKTDIISVQKSDADFIQGMVTDKNSKETLAGVAVECDGQKTYTDLEGRFTLRKPVKSSEIVISYISYEEQKVKLNDLTSNRISVELRQR
jgi:hypothetical protein